MSNVINVLTQLASTGTTGALMSCKIPARTIGPGQVLRFTAAGLMVRTDTTQPKAIEVLLGGRVVGATLPHQAENALWRWTGELVATSVPGGELIFHSTYIEGAGVPFVRSDGGQTGIDWTKSQQLTFRGICALPDAIQQSLLIVERL